MLTRTDALWKRRERPRQYVGPNGESRIDVDSDEFKLLPAAIQHEIVSELYVKSRETSWSRLDEMVQAAPISAQSPGCFGWAAS